MKVTVSRRLLDRFKREAKGAFPRETYAILLGKVNCVGVRITGLYIPENQDKHATHNRVYVQDMWWVVARQLADADKCTVIGELHSHAETSKFEMDAAPSEGDWDRAPHIDGYTHGICGVRKYPSGRMLARVRFWPTQTGITTQVTE
jgi:hypothetical protein